MIKLLGLSRLPCSILLLTSTCLLTSCSSHSSLQPFTTDGCSLFPDRSWISNQDWCACCVVHDLAYWRGGTAQQRLNADRTLQACVQQATGNKALAELMFGGVRAGGGPYYFTTYRWGYGWPYGRDYKPLTADETNAADTLEKQYRSTHSVLACPSERKNKP